MTGVARPVAPNDGGGKYDGVAAHAGSPRRAPRPPIHQDGASESL
jgi:hypothetical protein